MINESRKCNQNDIDPEVTPDQLMMRLHGLIGKIIETTQTKTIISKKIQEIAFAVNPILTSTIDSCEKILEDSKKVAGEFLHNLDRGEPDENDVKRVIATFPEALLYTNPEGYLPIQSAVDYTDSVKCVSLLAIEISQRKVGLERGGLMLPTIRNPNRNMLQFLVTTFYRRLPSWYEEQCVQGLKALRSAGLLLDEDIIRFKLFTHISHNKLSDRRFKYLLGLYPQALSVPLPNGNYPIHAGTPDDLYKKDIHLFARLLKAGMDHFPHQFGFLFKRGENGARAISQAIKNYGKDETLRIIQRIIESNEECPILHPVFRYTPELCEDFLDRYPNALNLKDRKGRHLLHVALKSGMKKSGYLLMMLHSNKSCVEDKDPVTNLYPFMLAASSPGRDKDLTTISKLLRLRPDVISTCLDNESDQSIHALQFGGRSIV